jgi:RNA polymerase sigma-70 factor (ECF subfamily)
MEGCLHFRGQGPSERLSNTNAGRNSSKTPWNETARLSDEELLHLCAKGESAGLEELTRRYQAPIYRFLLRMLGSPEDAEEAALEVFVRAWRNADRFQYRARVFTWLYRIANNLARDIHARKTIRPPEMPLEEHSFALGEIGSAEEDALRGLEREEQSHLLLLALDRLSEGDRLLLALYYLEEREYEEIQAMTGLSYTVLKTRLMRARRRLRALLDAQENLSSAANYPPEKDALSRLAAH